MIIPDKLRYIFNQIDSINKNGVLSLKECEKFKNDKNSIFNEFFEVEEGMTIEKFVLKNLNQPGIRESVQLYDNNNFSSGRFLADSTGKMVKTQKARRTILDDINSVEVMQGECKILNYTNDKKALQTFGVSTCIVVTIYNPTTKMGFLAHIDSAKRAESLKSALEELNFNPNEVEVRIFGGLTEYSEGTLEIINNILKEQNLKIVEQDVLGTGIARAIQLDLNTGEVFDYAETTTSELEIIPKDNLKKNF